MSKRQRDIFSYLSADNAKCVIGNNNEDDHVPAKRIDGRTYRRKMPAAAPSVIVPLTTVLREGSDNYRWKLKQLVPLPLLGNLYLSLKSQHDRSLQPLHIHLQNSEKKIGHFSLAGLRSTFGWSIV